MSSESIRLSEDVEIEDVTCEESTMNRGTSQFQSEFGIVVQFRIPTIPGNSFPQDLYRSQKSEDVGDSECFKTTWFGSISFSTRHLIIDVSFPTSSESIQLSEDVEVEDVACTHLHLVILMKNGKCGVRRIDDEEREFKFLDLNSVDSEFERLLVTTSREIYIVQRNQNQKTSEILKIFSEDEPKITRIEFPWPVKILEASGGHDFVIFRDSSGNLFSMGTGTRGELGVGLIRRIDEPVHIEHLAGIRIAKIVCGGWHTVALTDGGDAYTWGWNRHGQLGKDKAATEMYPMLVDPSEDIDASLSPDDNVDDVEATENTTRITVGSAHYVLGSDDVPVNEFAL